MTDWFASSSFFSFQLLRLAALSSSLVKFRRFLSDERRERRGGRRERASRGTFQSISGWAQKPRIFLEAAGRSLTITAAAAAAPGRLFTLAELVWKARSMFASERVRDFCLSAFRHGYRLKPKYLFPIVCQDSAVAPRNRTLFAIRFLFLTAIEVRRQKNLWPDNDISYHTLVSSSPPLSRSRQRASHTDC